MLPKELCKLVPKSHLMTEAEWRSIGVQQSQGWIHYMKHEPGNSLLYASDSMNLRAFLCTYYFGDSNSA